MGLVAFRCGETSKGGGGAVPFPEGFYLWVARWEGIEGFLATLEVGANMLCSAADIIFVFWFLRIADLARGEEGLPPSGWRYAVLAVCLVLTRRSCSSRAPP
jgi:hypothetical protein